VLVRHERGFEGPVVVKITAVYGPNGHDCASELFGTPESLKIRDMALEHIRKVFGVKENV
jgi:hypothetical protein